MKSLLLYAGVYSSPCPGKYFELSCKKFSVRRVSRDLPVCLHLFFAETSPPRNNDGANSKPSSCDTKQNNPNYYFWILIEWDSTWIRMSQFYFELVVSYRWVAQKTLLQNAITRRELFLTKTYRLFPAQFKAQAEKLEGFGRTNLQMVYLVLAQSLYPGTFVSKFVANYMILPGAWWWAKR